VHVSTLKRPDDRMSVGRQEGVWGGGGAGEGREATIRLAFTFLRAQGNNAARFP